MLRGRARACAFAGVLAVGMATSPAALAQSTGSGTGLVAKDVYTPADFTQFAPRSALDMVRRIPGFSLDGGDGGRGFGQGGANVLINGARVSGKSNDPFDALDRISANSVAELRVVDGATLDIPGLSGQVVNVITNVQGVSGQWRISPRIGENFNPIWLDGDVTLNAERGPFALTVKFENDVGQGKNIGPEQVFDGDGNLVETRDESFRFDFDDLSVESGIQYTRNGEVVGNLNLLFSEDDFNDLELSFRDSLSGADTTRIFEANGDGWFAEIGADYVFDVFGGRLKLIALQNLSTDPSDSRTRTIFTDGSETGGRFVFEGDTSESIVRAEYALPSREGVEWQIAGEAAFNVLDSETASFDLIDGVFVLDDGTVSEVRVEERRGEISLTHGRRFANDLSVQINLEGEYSELSQDGEGGLTRDFVRPKGSVIVSRQFGDDLSVRGRIERSVGQLDFFDFVTNQNLNNDITNAGNPDLEPEQSWEFGLEATRNLGVYGSITGELEYRRIEGVIQTRPLLPTGGPPPELTLADLPEGPGNFGDGDVFDAELSGTINFDPFGWRGAQLEFFVFAREARIDDPFTGERRRPTGDIVADYEFEFRHDIPQTNWAWGAEYFVENYSNEFRSNQFASFEETPGFGILFLEHKDFFGMRAQLRLQGVFDSESEFIRTRFAEDRSPDLLFPPIEFTEDRVRTPGRVARFSLEGSF